MLRELVGLGGLALAYVAFWLSGVHSGQERFNGYCIAFGRRAARDYVLLLERPCVEALPA